MLAGYAPVSATGWGIVVQRPALAATAPLNDLFLRTLYYSLPITLLSLLGIWWLATLISRPLRELADVAVHLDDRPSFDRIHLINGWYVEVALIRKALLTGYSAVTTRMSSLHRQTETDPLTSLINRRGLESALALLKQEGRPLAAIMFDIDHFKKINDTHGHIAGDQALVTVASIAKTTARDTDLVARMGGEEFVVLLPNATLDSAVVFAERLREDIHQADIPPNGRITVSLGVALYPLHTQDLDALLPLADTALYQAKTAGRNCVRVAGQPG
jgi:diguanylate cyclase (GGDEF)-like protein